MLCGPLADASAPVAAGGGALTGGGASPPQWAGRTPEGSVSVAFFQMIYQVLLGQERGPRFGSFVALYGIGNTRELIRRALAGEDLSKD